MNRMLPYIRVVITLLVVMVIIMTSIRLLLTPLFLEVEYRLPGFPSDQYGFNLEDRLKWSKISVDYLIKNVDNSYLENFSLSESTPLYNEREISHMLDVKILVGQMLICWYAILVILIGAGILAWRTGWLSDYWSAISNGGWWTIGLIVTILIGVAIGFNALFTGFHRIFFEGDTWLFAYSDTLIRLFPIRFWSDAFIFIGVISGLAALGSGLLGRKMNKINKDSSNPAN
ncbi:MAG: TIGR01906 family membrane protein [Anaerolineaceae bacterium]|nr:TIGR01906 family membrane protein [Anaerolineaceae bacterium]